MNSIRVNLFGAPRIERDGAAVVIERRRALGIFAFLVVEARVFSREEVTAVFWPDLDQSRGLTYLRNMLWTLNKTFGEGWAVVDRDTVAFNRDAGIHIDVYDFQDHIAARPQSAAPEDYLTAAAELVSAAELYRGDFMAGFTLADSPEFDDWQRFRRDTFRRDLITGLDHVCDYLIALRQYEHALPHARRRTALEPLDEHAHRRLMQLYIWAGQQAAAIQQYKELARVLSGELGVEPDDETKQMYQAILLRRIKSPELSIAVIGQGIHNPDASAHSDVYSSETSSPFNNLPLQTTPFIGRVAELKEIRRLLADPACRLLTLMGPGGIGKTRLAIQAGSETTLRDGVGFVPLASVVAGEFLVNTIAQTLNCWSFSDDTSKRQLLDHLSNKQMTLILDTFEHLLVHADLLLEMLANAPGLKILVTSRERLNLHEEWIFEVQGLTYPDGAGYDNLEAFSSVQLFLQSARRVRPEFAPTKSDCVSIVRICQLVEGMPLGIELAASWLHMLSCAEIAAEIQQSADFLTTPVRNLPERHRSLRAVFEYSWNRLDESEQRCLCRLALFRGGFTQIAAQVVAGASLHVLMALVGKSLLRRSASGRFEMHELLRQYAEQKLHPGELAASLDRHTEYFVEYLRSYLPLIKSSKQPEALRAIEREIDNIRVAWWNAAQNRNIEAMQRALETLVHFYIARHLLQEAMEIAQRAIDSLHGRDLTPPERLLLGEVLCLKSWSINYFAPHSERVHLQGKSAALLREFKGEPATAPYLLLLAHLKNVPGRPDLEAEALAEEALAIYEAVQDPWGIAYSLYSLGALKHNRIQYKEARRYLDQSLAMMREIGQQTGILAVMHMLSDAERTSGNYTTAVRLVKEAIPLVEQLDDPRLLAIVKRSLLWFSREFDTKSHIEALLYNIRIYKEQGSLREMAWTTYNLGCILHFDSQHEAAQPYFSECLSLFQQLGDEEGITWSYIFQGWVAVSLNQLNEAEEFLHKALDTVADMVFPWGVSGAYYVFGDIELARGNVQEATRRYLDAVRIAYEAESIMQTLRHLCGLAAVHLIEKRYEQAAELAAFLHNHPVSWDDTINRVRQILEAAAQHMPAEAYASAAERGTKQRLETLILELFPDLTLNP